LRFGGYPAVATERDENEKIEILRELKHSFLKKDANEAGIVPEQKFLQLMGLLASQIGNLVNKNEFANTLGIDNKTVGNYLYVMQKNFHIHLIHPFSNNLRKELVKMPKVFFSDFGLRNSLLNNFEKFVFRTDKGELLENYFFIRLSGLYEVENIKFWRTADQHEVDFVINLNFSDAIAYEVKFSENLIKRNKYNTFKELYANVPLNFVTFEGTDS